MPDLEVIESPQEVVEHIEKIIREGADSFETRHKTKSGEIRDIQVSSRVISVRGKDLIQSIWRDITEPKRAVEALQDSEKRYRALFQQAADSVVVVDPQTGALVEFNDKAHESLGYTREEFRKLKMPDLEVIESPQEVVEHIEKIIREGADSFETRHKTKSGEIRDIQVSSRVICIRGKDLIQAIWRDITDSKRADEVVRESQRQGATRNRIDKAFFTDTEEMYADVLEIILEAVKSKYGVFGYINSDGDLVCPSMTRDVWDKCRIPDKDIVYPRETWGGIWGRSMMECKTIYSNEPFRVPEGHIPIFRGLVVPIIRHSEAIGHIMVGNKATDYEENDVALLELIASHISPLLSARLRRQEEEKARKDAEDALRDSEQRYRALFEQAADSVVVVDPQTGALIEFNDKAHESLGYTREEFRKLKLADLEVAESPQEVAEHIEKVSREGDDSFETRHKTKSGEIRDIQISTRTISIRGKDLMQGIWRDVTARRQVESEKLAAAGRLAARIGHEINNPLAGIKNSFLVVKSALPQGHSCWEFVKLIDKEIERITRILHQTIDVYRPQPRGPEPLEIDKTIHDVRALLATECRTHRVSIIPEIPADLGHVHLAKDALVQVLFNVLGNAIEASPEAGKIRIALAAGKKSLTISVADEGKGIPADIRSEIFEPFFTTKPVSGKAKSGAGLGLSICRSLVESMGGSMDFESEVGRGTVFRIRLPRSHERNHHKEEGVQP